ncbi:LuxR C-terminal-related transcriptional regulator [Streptomyces fuscichromogenes]|uniref:DNA-binding response regulator n=1 Tax=Streptomyces fuscichromogenes TaxID=1324013 RepID=A0A918CQD7_9ACTN|nr:response regulator transcription factor [Streptomyces fuscichromogenes]GGN02155.1 DNA-binding response regulator [Streptomyces fuscichromogenes]
MITVLIADPHALHRIGLRTLLASRRGLTIAGEATTGTETARMHDRLRPDVVLLGSGLPAIDVTTTVRRLRQTRTPGSASPRVLVLNSARRDEHAYDVLRAGADGFLPDTTTPEELVAALFTVAAGDAVVPPRLARALIHAVRHDPRPEVPVPKGRLEDLTRRERDVLTAVAAGRSNAEIAAQLSIATTTVKAHVTSILTKTGARTRVQAVIFAYESGLVRPPLPPAGPSLPTPHRMTNREEPTCGYCSSRTTLPSPNRWNAA